MAGTDTTSSCVSRRSATTTLTSTAGSPTPSSTSSASPSLLVEHLSGGDQRAVLVPDRRDDPLERGAPPRVHLEVVHSGHACLEVGHELAVVHDVIASPEARVVPEAGGVQRSDHVGP